MKAVQDEDSLRPGTPKKIMKIKRTEAYKEMVLHGQYEEMIAGIRSPDPWAWLKKGTLNEEREGMTMNVHDLALRMNAIKSRIDKQDASAMCRTCGKREEITAHVVA